MVISEHQLMNKSQDSSLVNLAVTMDHFQYQALKKD